MTPEPPTLALTLTARRNATRLPQWTALARCPLAFVITTPVDLAGCLQLTAELHRVDSATGRWDPEPMAAQPIEFPAGTEHAVEFTSAQLNPDLSGQRGLSLLLTVTVVRPDGTPDTWVGGQLELEANPASGMDPGEPPDPVYAYVTAGLMTAEVTAREAFSDLVKQFIPIPLTTPGGEFYSPDGTSVLCLPPSLSNFRF
jgi:hypothetical protein